jgi:hypothetical protein
MDTDETRQVMTTAFTNYINWLEMRRDFAQAAQFTDAVKASFGGIVNIEESRRDVYHGWIVSLLDARQFSEADTLLAQPATRAAIDDKDWTALSVATVQRLAQAEGDNAGNLAAAGIIADSLKRLGRPPALLQTYEAYIHSAFATLFNARRAVDAKSVVDQALSVYPESHVLQQDLDMAKKAVRDNRS